jgi:hypothetical protein
MTATGSTKRSLFEPKSSLNLVPFVVKLPSSSIQAMAASRPTFCRLGYDVLESASCSAAARENLESGFSGD